MKKTPDFLLALEQEVETLAYALGPGTMPDAATRRKYITEKMRLELSDIEALSDEETPHNYIMGYIHTVEGKERIISSDIGLPESNLRAYLKGYLVIWLSVKNVKLTLLQPSLHSQLKES